MKKTEARRIQRGGTAATSRRGAMLVLAIVFIVLATSLAVLIMAGSTQLVRTTRHEHESILLRQLIDSGRAWARTRDGPLPDGGVTLSGNDILPEGISGEVRISHSAAPSEAIVITAEIGFSGRVVRQTTRFSPSS